MFRPLSEAFVRRSWYSVLPVLDTIGRCLVKKAVVCVAQLVAALITVHGLLSFLSDVHTTTFLTLHLPIVSRTGRTEYQLLLTNSSDRGQNVEFLGNNFGCV